MYVQIFFPFLNWIVYLFIEFWGFFIYSGYESFASSGTIALQQITPKCSGVKQQPFYLAYAFESQEFEKGLAA